MAQVLEMNTNSYKSVGKSEMDSWRQWAKQIKSVPQKPTQPSSSIPSLTQSDWEPIILPKYPQKIGCSSCRRFR